jgi:hypothetical protein
MTSFATELNALIRKHTVSACCADDFFGILNDLDTAADRLAKRADTFRFKAESAAEYRRRHPAEHSRQR